MSLTKDLKKEIINDPENRSLLIYPFVKKPTPDEVDKIDTLANFYINQAIYGFANYGFNVDDPEFEKDISLIKILVTAALYRNKRINHSFIDVIDELSDLVGESAETKELIGDDFPPSSPEE